VKTESKFTAVWILCAYYVLNAIGQTIIAAGGRADGWGIPSLLAGSVIGIFGTWLIMQLYKRMDVNTATAVSLGGGFLFAQIALAIVFAEHLTIWQYLGLGLITVGLFVMVKGERKVNKTEEEELC